MDLMQLLVKFFGESGGEDSIKAFMEAMKENNIHTASEENMDVRYPKLKTQRDTLQQELDEAKKLIFSFKESSGENDELKLKLTSYEQNLENLQRQNEQLKLQNEARFALLQSKALPDSVDFLLFKNLTNDVKLNENGELIGFDPEEIKKSFPTHFEDKKKPEVLVNELPDGEVPEVTKEKFQQMNYTERLELFYKDTELFHKLNE